jgi:hypothetical protein
MPTTGHCSPAPIRSGNYMIGGSRRSRGSLCRRRGRRLVSSPHRRWRSSPRFCCTRSVRPHLVGRPEFGASVLLYPSGESIRVKGLLGLASPPPAPPNSFCTCPCTFPKPRARVHSTSEYNLNVREDFRGQGQKPEEGNQEAEEEEVGTSVHPPVRADCGRTAIEPGPPAAIRSHHAHRVDR